MESAADQWLSTSEARCLIEIFDARTLPQTLTKRLRRAYVAGYQDGRKRHE